MEFISAHQHMRVGADGLKWGVESMCAVLSEFGVAIAPSTHYAHRAGAVRRRLPGLMRR